MTLPRFVNQCLELLSEHHAAAPFKMLRCEKHPHVPSEFRAVIVG